MRWFLLSTRRLPTFYFYVFTLISSTLFSFYTAPSLFNIINTVLQIILISIQILHSLMYWRSNLTTSSKSVMLLRPLTCHRPVIPGFIARRERWCNSYWLTSPLRGGRVPTMDYGLYNITGNDNQ